MPWTTPRTWVTGEVPTASTFNAHVRDNLNALDQRATHLGPWVRTAVAANQTSAVRLLLGDTALAANVHDAIVLPFAGAVLGLSAALSGARTAGSLRVRLFKNGVDTGESILFDATTTNNSYATNFTTTFAAGDTVDLRYTSDASWAGGTELTAHIWLKAA